MQTPVPFGGVDMGAESTAFCNSFWGEHDAGYHVMQSFIKNTTKTMEDLRAFYHERAEIEHDYAKRLAKLAKSGIGRHETGPMRHALDTVRLETDAQARSHQQLVNSIRKEVQDPLSDFMARVESLRRDSQTTVVKLFKHKHTQTQYVQRSREKYESDCMKVNAYTAQSNLVQGRELDKLMVKLERAQANIESDDRDYQSYVRALQDTTQKWNAEYKSFLDICQDVEEERQEFLKTNLWSLANAVSSVCVTDDEACERVRVSLEGCEAQRDVQMFVREFATGSTIPTAPEYINYAQNTMLPPQNTTGQAHFARMSVRDSEGMPPPSSTVLAKQPILSPSQLRTPSLRAPTPGMSPMASPGAASVSSATSRTPASLALQTPSAPSQPSHLATMSRTPPPQAISPVSRTPPPSTSNRNSMFAPGALPLAQNQAPSPTPSQPSSRPTSRPTSQLLAEPENGDDPIAKALANLRMRQSRKSPAPGSRPTSMLSMGAVDKDLPAMQEAGPPAPSTVDPRWQRAISPDPSAQRAVSPDPRMQARPISPAAAFMNPPNRGTSPVPVEKIHSTYAQAFPSERRSLNGSPVRDMQEPPRATTPLGLSLDANGAVAQDTMAGRYSQAPPAASAAPAAAGTSQLARPPTGQYSETGEPILFYVKALYDYAATLPEEFSFTAGDIIAVTHTEPDGWWQGELLDEARRVPGAYTFPSNFVVLLM
ncbi:formin-binding protein [Malassezia caprae]|uniref:Formin-binding protein n=1 Tax=Malassezia caprae TaxID=1381934 RepID=A0AAF0E6M6_9BASI|nr:formin-binding protein [Malassezia caprae]